MALDSFMIAVAPSRKPERTIKPLRVFSQVKINVTKDQFQEAQINDKNLSIFFDKADVYFPEADRKPLTSWYEVEDELLYRLSNNPGQTEPVKQLMVPTELRLKVLALGHEAMFAGHLGVKKTLDRISASFYWPGILQSVQRFCSSCDICQRTVRKGSVSRAPLHSIPVVNVLYCIESTFALQPCGCDPHAGFACATHHSVHHHLISLVEKSKGGGVG